MLAGDKEAFRLIVDAYKTHVHQLVYSVLRHAKDAEETAQDVFVKVYLSLPQYRQQGLTTWISRIAVNRAIDVKRQRERSRDREELSAEMEAHPPQRQLPPVNEVEARYMQLETKQTIRRLMDEMPEGYRSVVDAYYIRGQTYHEIAAEQGLQLKTVESKLYRAKHWIRQHWKEEDFS